MTTTEAEPAPSLELVSGRPTYRYYTAHTVSGELALELDMSGVSWSRQIRLAGTFSGAAGFSNDTALADSFWGTMPGLMSLYVVRGEQAVWGGLIARRSYDAATRQLQVEAVGFESYLYRRFIWHDLVWDNTHDQYDVVRGLINVMQSDFTGLADESDRATPHPESADLGITVQGGGSGITQDKQVFEGGQLTTFGEALEAFSDNLNGFEYNIDVGIDHETGKFTKNLWLRQAPPSQMPEGVDYTGPRPGLDQNFFEFPGNLLSVGYGDTVDDSGTRQFVAGKQPESGAGAEGTPQPPPARGVWENEPYLATQWPILETVESSDHPNVSDEALLDRYAKSYGQRMHPPVPSWTVTANGGMNPQPGSFSPGDWCRFVVTDPFLQNALALDGDQEYKVLTKRIGAFTVTVPDVTQLPEVVELVLIDEWDDEGEA